MTYQRRTPRSLHHALCGTQEEITLIDCINETVRTVRSMTGPTAEAMEAMYEFHKAVIAAGVGR